MPFDGKSEEIELGLILSAAADRIERVGWCQGCFSDDYRLCAVGAIRESAPDGVYASALHFFQTKLGVSNATEWNDDPARTKDEVVRALRGEIP